MLSITTFKAPCMRKVNSKKIIFFALSVSIFLCFFQAYFHHGLLFHPNCLEQLSTEELDVVLAHEQTQCQGRVVLRRLISSFAGLFYLSSTRQHLLSDLELAHEQICDIVAVQKLVNSVLEAETIIKVARQLQLLTPRSKMGIASFDGCHIDIRIQQLLEQPKPVNPHLLFFSTVFLSLITSSALMLTMPLHHLL